MNTDFSEPIELISPVEELLLSIIELNVDCQKGVTTTTTTTTNNCDKGTQ